MLCIILINDTWLSALGILEIALLGTWIFTCVLPSLSKIGFNFDSSFTTIASKNWTNLDVDSFFWLDQTMLIFCHDGSLSVCGFKILIFLSVILLFILW